jgi:hypothetical protein
MIAAEGFDPIFAVIGLPPGDRVGPTLGLASLAEIFFPCPWTASGAISSRGFNSGHLS